MRDRTLMAVLQKASKKELMPLADLLEDKSVDWRIDKKWTLAELRGEIEHELRLNGGSVIPNTLCREGPSWNEIVKDVADKLNIDYGDRESTVKIEQKVTAAALDKLIKKMSKKTRAKLKANLAKAKLPKDYPIESGVLTAGVVAGEIAGFAPYKALVISANLISSTLTGSGLAFATNTLLTKSLAVIFGPIGWAITGLAAVVQIGGPAYRITCPAVVMISLMRSQQRIVTRRKQ